MAKLGDLRFIAIVDVLASAKYFDRGKAGVPGAFQPDGGQAVLDEEVSGQYKLHRIGAAGSVSSHFAVKTRFSSALKRAVVHHDGFNPRHAVGGLDIVAHLRQGLRGFPGKSVLQVQNVGLPLFDESGGNQRRPADSYGSRERRE